MRSRQRLCPCPSPCSPHLRISRVFFVLATVSCVLLRNFFHSSLSSGSATSSIFRFGSSSFFFFPFFFFFPPFPEKRKHIEQLENGCFDSDLSDNPIFYNSISKRKQILQKYKKKQGEKERTIATHDRRSGTV